MVPVIHNDSHAMKEEVSELTNRIPEPELMDSEEQALCYAQADFAQPHDQFVSLFQSLFETAEESVQPKRVLDLGCGPGDISCRFAVAYSDCQVIGVDGAQSMLDAGASILEKAGLLDRVQLRHAYLPGADLPKAYFDTVISNSLLHHLLNPLVLWQSIKEFAAPGAAVFVMDLLRPNSSDTAKALVKTYAEDEPEILKKDFYYSLLAAYREDEVREQLKQEGLTKLQFKVVSDRHFVVYGNL